MLTSVLLGLAIGAPTAYESAMADLERDRRSLALEYRRARTRAAKRAVLEKAEKTVLEALEQRLLPAWYGTPWAFGGRTDTPKEGAIACGTFVGTVLEDAGFVVNRIALGRLASEHIALVLTSERNLRRYRNRPVEAVERELIGWGRGLYMVGLDRHAGLAIVRADGTARFVHSSYYDPMSVVSEPLSGDNPFADSRYRVLARLLDADMMKKWLRATRFRVPRRS